MIEHLDVDIAQWHYEPVAPFKTGISVLDDGEPVTIGEYHHLRLSLEHLVRFGLPPRANRTGYVIDANRQVVFGWMAHDEDRVGMYGCEAAFRILETLYEPVDVALWEAAAKGELTDLGWL